jgi:hypothetical protein
MNWFEAAGVFNDPYNPDSTNYCATLGDSWRLPTISEVRSMFRKGDDAGCYPLEWDMTWTSVPEGYCEAWDDGCLSAGCYDWTKCVPAECGEWNGPGTLGCYWDAALHGSCDEFFWSLSKVEGEDWAWVVNFYHGQVATSAPDTDFAVRCVRTAS